MTTLDSTAGDDLAEWKKKFTQSFIPYYVNVSTEVSQWDHPLYARIFQDLAEFGSVKYAAYRTSMKLRYFQKKLRLELIDLKTFATVLDRHGLQDASTKQISCQKLTKIVTETFATAKIQLLGLSSASNTFSATSADILVNWLLNICDRKRAGSIGILPVKIALATVFHAPLTSKYKFFFNNCCDLTRCISRLNLEMFISTMLQISAQFGEHSSFGGVNPQPAVDSCFSGAWSSTGISEDEFFSWLKKEPQTFVWLPTFHRLLTSETAVHESKCNVCKRYPLVGLRYKCLKCFNCDVCQQCFLTGRSYKKHKSDHPMQEYCIPTNAREDTRAFLKTLRNKLSKRMRQKQRLSYLPIPNHSQSINSIPVGDMASQSSGIQCDEIDGSLSASPSTPESAPDIQKKIIETNTWRSAIKQLDDEYRDLIHTIHSGHMLPDQKNPPSPSSANSQEEILFQRNQALEAQQDALRMQNQKLVEELKRLKIMLAKATPTSSINGPKPSRFQSTPAATQLSFNSPVSIITDGQMTPGQSDTPCQSMAEESYPQASETFGETDSALAETRYSLPSVSDVAADSTDEEELKLILDKMENMFAAEDDNGAVNVKPEQTLDEIYEAVNHIGDAFAAFSDKLSA